MSSRNRDEPVRLTRIYTRAGDGGETSLGDGSRVPKLDCRIGAFGTVDELNAALGVVLADPGLSERLRGLLESSEPLRRRISLPFGVTDGARVEQVHRRLSNGATAEPICLSRASSCRAAAESARLHVARTTCRRAERDALVANEENGINPLVLAYLNRLSDFLFIAARTANAEAGRDEPLWRPGG